MNGRTFKVKHYNIGLEQGDKREKIIFNRVQKLLFDSGLYKLPQAINLIKGDISIKGPEPLKTDVAMVYVQKYTDFYKRYAVKPGLVSPTSYFTLHDDQFSPEKRLKSELKYLVSNTRR